MTAQPHLSPREKQIAALLLQEKGNKEIANELGLTPGTVRDYLHHLIGKLKVCSRVGVALWAIKNEDILNGHSQDQTT